MAARRAVKAAKASEDPAALKVARASVDKAKVALGERGEVWWTDGAEDFNRRKVKNTPYAQWYAEHEASENRQAVSPHFRATTRDDQHHCAARSLAYLTRLFSAEGDSRSRSCNTC